VTPAFGVLAAIAFAWGSRSYEGDLKRAAEPVADPVAALRRPTKPWPEPPF
jgi:hypothetical protein